MLPIRIILCLILLPAPVRGQAARSPLASCMPRAADHTLMFWEDGFPGHTPSAPWHRVIRTGHYAMVLDTDTLRIPHLGPLGPGGGYLASALEPDPAWKSLPGTDLDLRITAEGKTWRCVSGGPWTRFAGPRIVESGRFLQRGDVTGLRFRSDDGAELNTEARLETVAWPDRLGLILAARPGLRPIPPGEPCFGHEGGGFGLDGTNHFEVPHAPEWDRETFTLELQVYVPTDFQPPAKTFPWLVCKNRHEEAEGNYGIVLINGKAQGRLNIGGGRENAFTADAATPLRTEAWNHLAISYDGRVFRLYQNGALAAERSIGRPRVPGRAGLSFGRRQDNFGDGYHFRGVIDDIRLHDHALTAEEWKAPARPVPLREFRFSPSGQASPVQPREVWRDVRLHLGLPALSLTSETSASGPSWAETGLCFDPATSRPDTTPVRVEASGHPVDHDARRAWHRIQLDGVVPTGKENDAIERVRLLLTNPSPGPQTARLLFEKSASGFKHHFGAPVTGISAILRTPDGYPSGIPVQLSKNWHNRPEGGVHSGQWFHGFSQVRLPPSSDLELELVIVYGHWGGLPAASHAQLCLIGWGSNQLWDQSALGAWGESICYEPDQVQAACSILDVRPVMVSGMSKNSRWSWTHNVGGGDFFRFFDPPGTRVFPSAMRTAYLRQGPCLTEVTYAGRTGPGLRHHATASLARTHDLVRATYHLRLDASRAVPFSRLVLFQVGADSYLYTAERKFALGNETGLLREWDAAWVGNGHPGAPVEATGATPWISLHQGTRRNGTPPEGAWANRGLVIRQWKARLGGRTASPWIAEHESKAHGTPGSTIDLLPPPGLNRLEPGDFVDATLEFLVVPQNAADYFGPDPALRAALAKDGNTWRLIQREASDNHRMVTVTEGTEEHRYPDIRIATDHDRARFTVTGGLGYVPVTFSGLSSPSAHRLSVDGITIDQSVHGRDFWQCDHDPASNTWSLSYNLPFPPGRTHDVQLSPAP